MANCTWFLAMVFCVLACILVDGIIPSRRNAQVQGDSLVAHSSSPELCADPDDYSLLQVRFAAVPPEDVNAASSADECSILREHGESGSGDFLHDVFEKIRHWRYRELCKKGHKVEHIELLKNERFWFLTGAAVFSMAIVVLKLETDPQTGDSSLLAGLKGYPWLHLGFCFLSLQVSMLLWGFFQELAVTQLGGSGENVFYFSGAEREDVISVLFPIWWNRLFLVMFFGIVLAVRGEPIFYDGFCYSGGPAISNSMASWCQYESLHFIPFALQTTSKTAKLLPVVIINSLRGKPQGILDYAEAIALVGAMFAFGLETTSVDGARPHATAIGMLLLVGLVVSDAVTPHLQEMIFEKEVKLSSAQLSFSMGVISCFILLAAQIVNGSFFPSLGYMHRHPEAILPLTLLAATSALTNYFMVYTVKHFGPVVLTISVSVRQMLSVLISSFVFHHRLTVLAILAMTMAVFIVLVRAIRKPTSRPAADVSLAEPRTPGEIAAQRASRMLSLLKCALAIHVLYCLYALAQEYLATHTYGGYMFEFPLFIVATSHTASALFALGTLKSQGIALYVPGMRSTAYPACVNFIATTFQHWALYHLFFPSQTLMKSTKVVPVMLIGRLLRNRTYTYLDYVEGIMITALVSFFVVQFQFVDVGRFQQSFTGILMMIVYVVMDSFTSPLEDWVYQKQKLDPGQMLLGIEVISGCIAWISLIIDGSLVPAIKFLHTNPHALVPLMELAVAAAAGAYTCTFTVKYFGPAVFVLLMMSRQTLSLVISVIFFQHKIDENCCVALVVVCLIILVSSIRRAAVQTKGEEDEHIQSMDDSGK